MGERGTEGWIWVSGWDGYGVSGWEGGVSGREGGMNMGKWAGERMDMGEWVGGGWIWVSGWEGGYG